MHWFVRLSLFVFLAAFSWFFLGYQLPRFLPEGSVANTAKYGIIVRSEHWSGEIKILGDIAAFPGTTVTVDPGTKILVAKDGDKFNLHWWPWELRSGLNTGEDSFGVKNGELFRDEREKIQLHFAKLLVWGTKEQPVEIRSDEKSPGSPYDFNVISMDSGIISNARMSGYRQFLVGDKSTIRNSEFDSTGECAVCAEYSSPSIINNIFHSSLRQAVLVVGGSPKISDNLFDGALGEGVVVDPRRFGAPVIYHNSFETPGRTAVRFLSGGEEIGGAVSLNDFAGSTVIVLPCDSRVKLIQNQIRGLVKLSAGGSCTGNLSLGPNWWQTVDKEAILREKIIGKEAVFELLLPAILSSPSAAVGRRGTN